MKPSVQLELPVRSSAPLFTIDAEHPNVQWLVDELEGRDWTSCDEILIKAGKPLNEYHRRWVRALAEASGGRVIGQPGKAGYKLTTACTAEEYQRWRNTMLSQSNKMRSRVIASDQVFYARRPAWPLTCPPLGRITGSPEPVLDYAI